MAPQPKMTVKTDGRIVGYVIKTRIAWHFRPGDGTPMTRPTSSQMTLQQLGEDIKLAFGVKEIQFHEVHRPVKAAAKKKRSSPSKKRGKRKLRKLNLSQEEWRSIEREQARYSPRPVSVEARPEVASVGRSVSGGLPGLGKRR